MSGCAIIAVAAAVTWALFVVPVLLPAVLLGLILFTASSSAASFGCTRAAISDEKAVCANPRLSTLDELMGKAYGQAKTKGMITRRPCRTCVPSCPADTPAVRTRPA